MPTWDETREYIRGKYKVAMDEPTWLGLAFSFTLDGAEVGQRERIEPVTALGQPALLIWADVVETNRVPNKLALQRNMSFEIGGLAISENLYVLRVVLPHEGMSWALLDEGMLFVAREAARLRAAVPAS